MEPPVRLKLYGLVTVTRRGYLAQLAVAAVLLIGLLVVWVGSPRDRQPKAPTRTEAVVWGLLDSLPWIVLALGVLFALEAFVVLRRFARAEAAQRARAAEPQPGTPTPG
jgi:hypothetical protein